MNHRDLQITSWIIELLQAICRPQITSPLFWVFLSGKHLLPCVVGADIAEVMLDFIDWLTHQEFGRRCVVSIRDILSWVNFMNTMGEEAALKRPETISTVTAFVHAACLVYIDGIGSGMFSVSWWEPGVRVKQRMKQSKSRLLAQILYRITYSNKMAFLCALLQGTTWLSFSLYSFLRCGQYKRYAPNFSLLISKGLSKYEVMILSRKKTVGNALAPS